MLQYHLWAVPFFHQELCLILKSLGCEFSVSFDECMNKTLQEGQMDLHVRFWDNAKNEIIPHYWNSDFFGESKGNKST